MEFTTSDGEFVDKYELQNELGSTIEELKWRPENSFILILSWELEFLEWFFKKEIKCEKSDYNLFRIQLHEDITEEELEQLEQLIDYLEL